MKPLVSDGFDRANSSSLGSNWDTVFTESLQVKDQKVRFKFVQSSPRNQAHAYNAVRMPNNQYAKIRLGDFVGRLSFGGRNGIGVIARRSGTTFYEGRLEFDNLSNITAVISKWISGTETVLDQAVIGSVSDLLGKRSIFELRCENANIYTVLNDQSVGQITDNSIASGLHTGISMLPASSLALIADLSIEDFEAGELMETPPQDPPPIGWSSPGWAFVPFRSRSKKPKKQKRK